VRIPFAHWPVRAPQLKLHPSLTEQEMDSKKAMSGSNRLWNKKKAATVAVHQGLYIFQRRVRRLFLSTCKNQGLKMATRNMARTLATTQAYQGITMSHIPTISTDNRCVSVQTTLWTLYLPIERIQRYKHGESLATNLIQVAIWILPHGEHLNSERPPPPAEWGEDEERRVRRTSCRVGFFYVLDSTGKPL
jgi:hypothetical protein